MRAERESETKYISFYKKRKGEQNQNPPQIWTLLEKKESSPFLWRLYLAQLAL